MDLDAEAVSRARAGDREAFEALVRATMPRVRRMAMHYFASPFEQEEALQEVFLLLYRQRASLDPNRAAELPGFISTLARRRFIDLVRARRPEIAVESIPEPPAEEAPPAATAEQAVALRELRGVLAEFAKKLEPQWREFFQAAFVDGHDEREAAEAVGVSVRRARYLKQVLLARLRRHVPLRAFREGSES